jgi:hypothetical protein
MAPAAALVADADETSNGGVAFGSSGANQQRSTVVRMRAIRPLRQNSAFALLRP